MSADPAEQDAHMGIVRIANASGFWGDDPEAPLRVVQQTPGLDYLTLDYLAEVSMSILAKQRERNPSLGYAGDFVRAVGSLAPLWKGGRKFRVVSNGGGLNAPACAAACAEAMKSAGCTGLRLAVVTGDDVLPKIRERLVGGESGFSHLETGASIATIADRLTTASAYLGAAAVVEALRAGADIVITGRLADPSLTVAPAAAHFGWALDDYSRIAGATVAGHLIECGAQVTGGISTDWLDIPDKAHIGFPIVEIADDGSCVVTKPANTGGRVTERAVKEQLLYEIGDPAKYLSPDATVSFLNLRVDDLGHDRVRVSGAQGSSPPPTYKVSATYGAGYRAAGMLTLFGRDVIHKAQACGEVVLKKMEESGHSPQRWLVECLGTGAVVGHAVNTRPEDLLETVLRISLGDQRREVVEYFTRQLMPLVTAGPQGVTGYAEGRPAVHEVFGYWPTLIGRAAIATQVEFLEV
ncbi:MAG TPA: acyclic terpene utilization AtuA family protein [Tepidisphaeraceae bacterium]|jgi:hypothetical protein